MLIDLIIAKTSCPSKLLGTLSQKLNKALSPWEE